MTTTDTRSNLPTIATTLKRVLGTYVHIADGKATADVRFPGGRLDASIDATGAWTIIRTDFARGAELTGTVESRYAAGDGVDNLIQTLRDAVNVLTNGVPVVGGPATYTLATDSHACTVVSITHNGTKVTLRRDKATLLNGANSGAADALTFSPGGFFGHTSGTQRYTYEADPNGSEYVVTRRTRKNGTVVWKLVGHNTMSQGCGATFTARHEHYDFNF